MSTKRRQALGRGLSSLLAPAATSGIPEVIATAEFAQESSNQRSVINVPVEAITPSRHQPRQDFDNESLKELAESIRHNGVIQPLVVQKVKDGYELIAGERRWRAAKMADLTEVPCLPTQVTKGESLLIALVENLQREDLNAIDEAEAFARLRDDFGFSQEATAEQVGKSRVAVANSLRLLGLPREMQEDVRDGTLTAGHARALLGIADPTRRKAVWREAKDKNLTVRETEERARAQSASRQTSAFTGRPRGKVIDHDAQALAEALMAQLGCRVTIRGRGKDRGRVELHYTNHEELERILEVLGLPASERL